MRVAPTPAPSPDARGDGRGTARPLVARARDPRRDASWPSCRRSPSWGSRTRCSRTGPVPSTPSCCPPPRSRSFADVRRVRQWGLVVGFEDDASAPWSGARDRSRSVIAAAVLVPGLLRGSAGSARRFPRPPATRGRPGSVHLDPRGAHRRPPSVTCSRSDIQPAVLATLTLDEFDGKSGEQRPGRIQGRSDRDGPDGSLPSVAEIRSATGDQHETFTFRVLTDFDNAHALPMVQTPEQITAGDLGDVTWDPSAARRSWTADSTPAWSMGSCPASWC